MSSHPSIKAEESAETTEAMRDILARCRRNVTYMWDAMTYRQLQVLAKTHLFPCNLKKHMLKSLLKAKLEGDHEGLGILLKQVKQEKSNRKKKKQEKLDPTFRAPSNVHWSEYKKRNLQILAQEQIQREAKVNVDDRQFEVRDILKEIIKKETRNVTVCQTEIHAQYKTNISPANTTGYTGEIFKYQHQNTSASRHNSGHDSGAVPCQSDMFPAMHLEPPPFDSRYLTYPNNQSQARGGRSVYGLDEYLGMRQSTIVKHEASTSRLSPTIHGSGAPRYSQSPAPVSYHALPPFETMIRNKMIRVETTVNADPATSPKIDSSNLEFLANTAMSMSENKDELKTPGDIRFYKVEPFKDRCSSQRDELITGNANQVPEDIPTWNKFMEQMCTTCSTGMIIHCKFGCKAHIGSLEEQLEHETHCLLQSIECPLPHCIWYNQLLGIGTHIFTIHNGEVIRSGNACFKLNFANEMYNDYYNPSEGPKRLCFIQMVNGRLFVVQAVANFQIMQLWICIQFVNDNLHWKSSAAMEICRQDGVPCQWSGSVYPVSYRLWQLLPRQKCLIIPLSTDQPITNNITLHTFIRNYQNSDV